MSRGANAPPEPAQSQEWKLEVEPRDFGEPDLWPDEAPFPFVQIGGGLVPREDVLNVILNKHEEAVYTMKSAIMNEVLDYGPLDAKDLINGMNAARDAIWEIGYDVSGTAVEEYKKDILEDDLENIESNVDDHFDALVDIIFTSMASEMVSRSATIGVSTDLPHAFYIKEIADDLNNDLTKVVRAITLGIIAEKRRDIASKADFPEALKKVSGRVVIPMLKISDREPFDESKVRRIPKGMEGAGRFAPKTVAEEMPVSPEKPGFFEPSNLGAKIGSIGLGTIGWLLADKYLPEVRPRTGFWGKAGELGLKAGRLTAGVGATILAGAAGEAIGRQIGNATYWVRGKRPPEPVSEEASDLGEAAAETAGSLIGYWASIGKAIGMMPKTVYSTAGSLAGEALAGKVYTITRDLLGDKVAESAASGVPVHDVTGVSRKTREARSGAA